LKLAIVTKGRLQQLDDVNIFVKQI